ncbi:hypothetical protein PIIN_03093 [Serendipita indica DSM 11827]|uniref:VWFA domain-containing protein n=1 Tax=Serendipita indica (strain DSM 11827) TaxID=1109443 RepID=G4TD13_SERID|nr:hypothetical protein PIIN_03093 [Serendipita indica DSM 11827]
MHPHEDDPPHDEDEDMFSVHSEYETPTLQTPMKSVESVDKLGTTSIKGSVVSKLSGLPGRKDTMDLLDRIDGMYRLLDLVKDWSVGGAVDKVIIAQDSLSQFANRVHPASYVSLTKVNFHALDKHRIRPRGVYGSIPAIADFLLKLDCIDEETRDLLVAPRDESSGVTRPTLRPGIYIIDVTTTIEPDLYYLVFWPDDTTWDDDATGSRNRVTFMRYLTKLCDQLVCLISDEHSKKLVWQDDDAYGLEEDNLDVADKDLLDRLFTFSVKQMNDEEENAIPKEGFTLQDRIISVPSKPPRGYPPAYDLDALQPQLVVGDLTQAIMSVEYIPEELQEETIDWSFKRSVMEEKLKKRNAPRIELDGRIDKESLQFLLELNLGSRCGDLETRFRDMRQRTEVARERDYRQKLESDRMRMQNTLQRLEEAFPFWLIKRAVEYYDSVSEEALIILLFGNQDKIILAEEVFRSVQYVDSFFEKNPTTQKKIVTPLRMSLDSLETGYFGRYNTLKHQFRRVYQAIELTPVLKDTQIQSLVDIITYKHGFDGEFARRYPSIPGETIAARLKRLAGYGDAGRPALTAPLKPMSDIQFIKEINLVASQYPVYRDACNEIMKEVVTALAKKINDLRDTSMKSVRDQMNQYIINSTNKIFNERKKIEEESAWIILRKELQSALDLESDTSKVYLMIRSVKRETPSAWEIRTSGERVPHPPKLCDDLYPDKFNLKGTLTQPNNWGFRYSLHQLQIKAEDIQSVTTDATHVCQPSLQRAPSTSFILQDPRSLRFARLVGQEGCLIVIEDDVSLKIFFDTLSVIGASISNDKHKKRFLFERVGKNHTFAVDETKRLFAMVAVHPDAVKVHVYSYDQDHRTLNAKGTAIDIVKWYPRGPPDLHGLVFVPGTEELLLIEQSGQCRLFYLPTETFRPASLTLMSPPLFASMSSDGSGFFVLDTSEGRSPRLRFFHWASFGTTNGIDIPLPQEVTTQACMAVSSLGHKNSNHVLFLRPERNTCFSVAVKITRLSTEFEFTANDTRSGQATMAGKTVNNSLIDCHAEVWTRFPIHASIRREANSNAHFAPHSILFVSSVASSRHFDDYFATKVAEFEHKTRKPTRRTLSQIQVSATTQWDPKSDKEESFSVFDVGDWLVGLLCLIPIHLAITRSNRLVPLKDGVTSPAYEQSLLGANVSEIAESITFGWYESIFNSYLAARPVKVVTSMGEQSVGKSYALNHFVDTSFAGSAMRCTEGVWLSATVTRDTIYVALDFEGVHSIERSAQEDTLLVLLNTAISNFVLFRNNFALSRDITELFTSFQSCTTILDPSSNPGLFQSSLIIIVKDVISSDAKEIKNEFTQKFARIVQQERGQNFITKLHKGQLDIIPWPVIESAQFYGLFDVLRDRLVRRPTTHKHAVLFVDVLKTLMAKLKANDWGALDQNLILQRVEYLSSMLATALAFGTCDPGTGEPLKNCDTDEIIDDAPTEDIFYIPSAVHPDTGEPLSPTLCLTNLRRGWADRFNRFDMEEDDFLRDYNIHLQSRADIRIESVRNWLLQNVRRFGERSEITSLLRRFEGMAKELKAAIVLCEISCAECRLLCLEPKYHTGRHDCKTSHRCHRVCAFAEQHADEIPQCDMPAGHPGKHLCTSLPHLCGAPCYLSDRDGCMKTCVKPGDHEGDEHLCPAPVHACGEPCDLILEDGTPLCDRSCVIDFRREHDRHCCERVSDCPQKCQMKCGVRCAAGDHFHSLEKDAVHLCGQEHVCPHDCEDDGICEIATKPQKVESVFVGKKDTFQYTKYTQEARKQKCCILIEPDKLSHPGRHVHSTDPKSFHYCEKQCDGCGYYCVLPLRHPQKDHETAHGSMEQTEWLVDGDDTAAITLDGRRFASGDSGAPMLCSLFCKSMGRHVVYSNDVGSTADQLLDRLPRDATEDGGTNFTDTLRLLQRELENTGASERYPVVIFLSDGECRFEEEAAYDLFRAAVRLGKPLAFHAVGFSEESVGSVHLERMTQIATEIYDSAPPDPLLPAGVNPCSFHSALDTVQLANTYLSIAESLGNPRAALRRI